MQRIDSQPQNLYAGAQARPAAGMPMAGRLAGQPVAQLDPNSVLANAADEMTQAFSTRVQERSLRERTVSVGTGSAELDRERLRAMLAELSGGQADADSGGSGDALQDLAKKILGQPGQARQLARELGGDASGQYLALLEVAELMAEGGLGADPGGRAQDAVQEAIAELMAEHGQSIRADINTFDAAQTLGPGGAQAFRAVYRDSVLGAADIAATLNHLLQAAGGDRGSDFSRVLQTMVAALGLDLAAARPSTDPVRLQSLVSDLYQLEVIATVVDRCGELSQSLNARHGLAPFSATGMAGALVSLTGERWIDAARLTRVAEQFGAHEPPTCTVDFLAGARNALRDLPVKVFASPEARQTLLDAAQGAVDSAVDREEGYA